MEDLPCAHTSLVVFDEKQAMTVLTFSFVITLSLNQ